MEFSASPVVIVPHFSTLSPSNECKNRIFHSTCGVVCVWVCITAFIIHLIDVLGRSPPYFSIEWFLKIHSGGWRSRLHAPHRQTNAYYPPSDSVSVFVNSGHRVCRVDTKTCRQINFSWLWTFLVMFETLLQVKRKPISTVRRNTFNSFNCIACGRFTQHFDWLIRFIRRRRRTARFENFHKNLCNYGCRALQMDKLQNQ